MKILLAAPYFAPRTGGLETYAWHLAQGLRAAGAQVVVACGDDVPSMRREQLDGLVVYRLPIWRTVSNTPVHPAWPWLLRRIVRVRALVVGIAGVLAGAAAGALLALLVTRVVSVTARATTSDLPMQTSFDLRVLVVAALAYLLLAAALVALATRRAFRDDRGPARAQEAGT